MITVDLDDFLFELKDGAIQHVGASNRTATAKLYDVADVDVREYGDDRVKVTATDEDGSTVEVALSAEHAQAVLAGLERLQDEGQVFE